MNVRELIDKLKEFNPDAIVKLDDWNEKYRSPGICGSVDGDDKEVILDATDLPWQTENKAK